VHEALGALRVVKSFGQEERETEHFARRLGKVMRRRLRVALLEGRYELSVGLLTAVGTGTVLFIGIGHVRADVLSLGDLLLVMGYLAKLYQPVKTIARKSATLQGHLASAERAFALLDQLPDVAERADARPIYRARGSVAFRDVSFAYGPKRPVLHEVSFEAQPGTRLGIVGTTGAGKSTLTSLLTRLYDPTAGAVMLDGVDLRDYRVDDVRRQFAVVQQDPVLFSVSIAENIAYAVPEASREQIVAAAEAANAHEFIQRLPQGYETMVGERGVMLSGGQRQRIALARAFLKDSPVLILDEPTSAVDPRTEAAILDATLRLMQERTVILVTHRTSLLEGCSTLLVLEGGRVVSEPTTTPAVEAAPALPAAHPARRPSAERHPAVLAWSKLSADLPLPQRITPLKRWNGKLARERKTMVYRLEGVGTNGGAVTAKRCRIADAEIERTVHEEVLSSLDLPLLRYYGCVEDADGQSGWLFLEEATGQDFSVLLTEHRALAGRWLGLLHSSAARARPRGQLRDASSPHYLEHLRAARKRIRANLDNPVLTPEDLAFLEELQVRLDELEQDWSALDETLDGAPETLVHGDFNGKNLRVGTSDRGAAIEVFDWEDAGWGIPAVDLAQVAVPSTYLSANPDLENYFSVVRERWPDSNLEALGRLAGTGTVFRAMAALDWDSTNLAHDWASGFVMNMRLYWAEMARALDVLGWARESRRASARSTSALAAGLPDRAE
jgi:ABC-type transport system involved in Fe-S cluster assembly fused permease/ATPase subunit